AGAAVHSLAFRLDDLRPAHRAAVRHLEDSLCAGPLAHDRGDYLRNDLTRPLDEHRVADTDVLAVDVLFVVQGRKLHDDPTDLHRLEDRERVQAAGAANVNADLLQRRRRLGWRELVRDGPARLTPDVAELLVQRAVLDLDDDAVDLIVELLPLVIPGSDTLDHVVQGLRSGIARVHFEAVSAELLQKVPM